MRKVKVLSPENIGKVKMSLPERCQKCPYRQVLQQLLSLWDVNLMKDNGLFQYQNKVKALEKQVKILEETETSEE